MTCSHGGTSKQAAFSGSYERLLTLRIHRQIFGDESSDLEDIIETDTAYARMLARDEQKKKAAKAAARAPTAA